MADFFHLGKLDLSVPNSSHLEFCTFRSPDAREGPDDRREGHLVIHDERHLNPFQAPLRLYPPEWGLGSVCPSAFQFLPGHSGFQIVIEQFWLLRNYAISHKHL